MKRLIILLMLVFANVYAMAQATSLVVDNQTPGWLSSKINYGDQLTLVNLKVTGYVNSDDMAFISGLSTNKKLQGILDLSDAHFVGMGRSYSYVGTGDIDDGIYESYPSVQHIMGKYKHILFPKSLKYAYDILRSATADTVTIGGYAMPVLSSDAFDYTSTVKHLIIREGVDSLRRGSKSCFFQYYRCLQSLYLPSTLKHIDTSLDDDKYWGYHYAPGLFGDHKNLKEVNLPDSIEYLQDRMFINVPAFMDTVRLPKMLKEYYMTTFGNSVQSVPDSQVVYISDNVSKIHFVAPNNYWECHVTRMTPLAIDKYSNKNIHVYVPKSALKEYQESNWSGFTLHAEPNPATNISVNNDTLKLQKGHTGILSAIVTPSDADSQELSWYTANSAIAIVDANGKITAVSSGSTYIYVSLINNPNLKDSCLVTVYQPVTSLQLNNSEKEIKVGDNFTLTATVSPYDADNKNIVWKSDNSSIASVVNGKVTGEKAGTAIITALSESDRHISAQCTVIVLQPVTGISLDKTSCQLSSIGETAQLTATVLPEDASNKTINWRSSNESVCIVSNGQVVAVGSGDAVIIVTTADGGYMATCLVKVSPTSGIDNVHINNTGNYQIFTTEGKKLNKLVHGINIIKFKNGITKKVVVQ